MPKFKGTVCRTSYAFRDIEVEANTEEEAREKMLDEAGDYEYSEKSSEYTLDGSIYIQKEFVEQTISFVHEGKKNTIKFTPKESDEWRSFERRGIEFDVHYLEDEDNNICVYLVKDGVTQNQNTIHSQKIVL